MHRDLQEKEFFSRHALGVVPVLKKATVGVAGAGGLGSNIAVALARSGVGKLVVADYDRVEPHNLNRQYYFRDQIGMYKVDALKSNLERVNPFSEYEMHNKLLDKENIPRIFGNVDILLEALDSVDAKLMLLQSWIAAFPQKPLVMGSGMGGYGGNNGMVSKRLFDRVYVCGDEKTDVAVFPPMAPKVMIVAAMQANMALEWLLDGEVIV